MYSSNQKLPFLKVFYIFNSSFFFIIQNIIENLIKQLMSTFLVRKIDQKLSGFLKLKKIISEKYFTLENQAQSKMQNYEKFLKYLKKQLKEHRITEDEINFIGHQFLQEVDNFLRQCYWRFRLDKTVFEALFVKLKFNQQAYKKHKHDFDEIINFQVKQEGEILMNCKDQLLIQVRNKIQHFDLKTMLKKTDRIFSQIINEFKDDQTLNMNAITSQICKNYNIIPFHNFTHAFGVFVSFYVLSNKTQIKQLINSFQMTFGLLACLSHDIQHQGNNTLFQVKTNTHSAIQFGKLGVMEKMHLSTFLNILIRNKETNKLFESLTIQQRTKARRIVSKAILATDMSKHYQYVENASKKLDKNSSQDRDMMIELLIHACDIDNPSLEFQSYMHWAHLVCIEFHEQTIKEQVWNVQVTEFLKFDSLPYFYKNQINFVNTIVLPLWESLSIRYSQIQRLQYTQRMKKNLSILSETLRRNSEPTLANKSIQQYLHNKLAK